MTEKKQSVKKKTSGKKKKSGQPRKLTPFTKLLCFLLLAFSAFLIFEAAQELYKMFQYQQEVAEASEKYQEVLDENVYLTTEKEKLTDPDYVQSYARGNYMLSKDGERIFYLPEKEN